MIWRLMTPVVCALAVAWAAFAPRPQAHAASASIPSAATPERRQILILYSYTTLRGYSYRQQRGILTGLDPDAATGAGKYDIFEESMAAEDQASYSEREFADRLRARYQDAGLDLIIVTDTPAIEFMDRQWESCLPMVPMVFSAPSRVPPRFQTSNLPVTGVVEVPPGPATVEFAVRAQPGLRRLYVLVAGPLVGSMLQWTTTDAAKVHGLEVEFPLSNGPDECLRILQSAPPGSAAVYLGWPAEKPGGEPVSAYRAFREAACPVYCLYEAHVGTGVVGGIVASGRDYGLETGRIARRILNGEDPRAIPINWEGVNTPMFDARQLARWGIPRSMLPSGAEVRYDNLRWHQRNRGLLVAVIVGSAVGLGLLILLARERRAAHALRQSEERFRAFSENLPGMAYATLRRPDGRRVAEYLGPGLEALVGVEEGARIRVDVNRLFDHIHPDDRDKVMRERMDSLSSRRPFDCEYRFQIADGTWRWLRATATPTLLADGSVRWHGVVLSIDRAKRTEIALCRRDDILNAVAETGRVLAQSPEYKEALGVVVRLLGLAAGADRAYLFDRVTDPALGPANRMIAEWTADGIPAQIDDPTFAYLPDAAWDRDRWLAPLARGETIVRAITECPEPERSYFESQQLQTIALVPVILNSRQWGFLGFDAIRQPTQWSHVELGALQTAATAIAAALERADRETRLRQSEEQYRLVFEATNDILWDWDIASDRIHWSESLVHTLGACKCGLTADAAACFRRIHPDDAKRVAEGRERFIVGDTTTWHDEYRFRRTDGSYAIVSDRASVVRDPSGKAVRVIGAMSDITRLKDTEAQLRESEERYRTMVESLPVGVLVHDGDNIDFANEAVRSIFRAASVAEIARTRFADLVHPDFHPVMPEHIKTVMVEGLPIDPFELQLLTTEGAPFDAEIRCAPIHFLGQRRIQSTILDLSARRRAEKALLESEAKFRQITENAQEVFWLADSTGRRLEYLSPAFESLWGVPLDSPAGNSASFFDRIHPDDRAQAEASIRAAFEGREHDFRIIRPDGSFRWIRDRAYPVRDEHGNTVKIAGVAWDITGARHAEDTLRRIAHTRQLLLNELDHRVKNSLSGLLTLIDLTRTATKDVADFADSIRARVLAMASVHSLLSEGHWEPVSFARLVRALHPPEAIGRIDSSGPPVDIPARQVTALATIVQELFTNSVKYGAAGNRSGLVSIHWVALEEATAAAGPRVRLTWRESGCSDIRHPVAPGVGTRLIQGFCKFELNGSVEFRFGERHVEHTLTFTLDPLHRTSPMPGSAPARQAPPPPASLRRERAPTA